MNPKPIKPNASHFRKEANGLFGNLGSNIFLIERILYINSLYLLDAID
jgi:hypothetical protein